MSDGPIDLRSDTVTRPTAAMRRAMAEAEVGDDVYREDPTVRALEEQAAAILGKDAALFVPSGTMGNQVSIQVWTRPGQEVVAEERSHIVNHEMAAMAAFSGVLPRIVRGEDGAPTVEDIRDALRPPIYYLAQTGLITLENTHNMAGGTLFPDERAVAITSLARERGIPVHLDGARLFNAAVATRRSAADLARPFDSVMVCLSKGLGAPVGSLIAGSRPFVTEALRARKRFGGGMRQAGVLAAAGLVALRDQVDRLAEDHANARLLAERVAAIEGLRVDKAGVQTNIVMFEVDRPGLTAPELVERWKAAGTLALVFEGTRVRAVTHYEVDRAGIEKAAAALAGIVTGRS